MTKAMRYGEVRKALLANQCTGRPGKGDHEVWHCPCGKHIAVVTTARVMSPGVVRDAIKRLDCLPKGWLQ